MKILRKIAKYAVFLLAAYGLLGAAVAVTPMGPLRQAPTITNAEQCHRIFLRRNTVHMALVVNTNDVRRLGGSELASLSQGKWLDFGWGDHQFYTRLHELTGFKRVGVIMNALLWPSYSSVHVAGYDFEPMSIYERSDIPYFQTMEFMKNLPRSIIELRVPSKNLANLVGFLRSEIEDMEPVQQGRFTDGRFYSSTSKYHLLATCNSWAAEGLRQAGFDINPRTAIIPKMTLSQINSQPHDLCPPDLAMADYSDAPVAASAD